MLVLPPRPAVQTAGPQLDTAIACMAPVVGAAVDAAHHVPPGVG